MTIKWIRQDLGITEEDGIFTIPFPPPLDPSLPLMEKVLLSAPIKIPKKITIRLQIKKKAFASLGLFKEKWHEFAFFLVDNIENWQGQEIGFRFPLDVDSNTFTYYLQYPSVFGPNIKDEYRTSLSLDSEKEYIIEFEKIWWVFYRIKFSEFAEGSLVIEPFETTAILTKDNFNIALISHNWTDLDEPDQYMKLYGIEIQE